MTYSGASGVRGTKLQGGRVSEVGGSNGDLTTDSSNRRSHAFSVDRSRHDRSQASGSGGSSLISKVQRDTSGAVFNLVVGGSSGP